MFVIPHSEKKHTDETVPRNNICNESNVLMDLTKKSVIEIVEGVIKTGNAVHHINVSKIL